MKHGWGECMFRWHKPALKVLYSEQDLLSFSCDIYDNDMIYWNNQVKVTDIQADT